MVKTFFTNKETIKKILVALIIVITCNFILPCYSNVVFADGVDDQKDIDKFERIGSIFKPIRTFILFLGDSVLTMLQSTFVTLDDPIIEARAKDGTAGDVLKMIGGTVLFLGGLAVTVLTFFSPIPGDEAAAGAATAGYALKLAQLASKLVKGVGYVVGASTMLRRSNYYS